MYLTDVWPVFAYGDLAERLLGPVAPSGRTTRLPTRKLRAFTAIKRAVKERRAWREALANVPEWMRDHAMVVQAQQDPELFRRYLAELGQPAPVIREQRPWAAALMAATANAALENLDSPLAVFAAGQYLERRQLITYLEAQLGREHQNATRATETRIREGRRRSLQRSGSKGGKKGAGKSRKPHTTLLARLVREFRPKTFTDLVRILHDDEAVERAIGTAPVLPMFDVTYNDRQHRLEYEYGEGHQATTIYASRGALAAAFKRCLKRRKG